MSSVYSWEARRRKIVKPPPPVLDEDGNKLLDSTQLAGVGCIWQRQTAVTAYLKSKQLLLFAFARRYKPPHIVMTSEQINNVI